MEGNALSSLRADLHSLSKVASGLRFTNVQSQPRNCRPRLSSSSSSSSDDHQETGTGGIGISNDDAVTTTTPPCDSDNDDDVIAEALPSSSEDDDANDEALTMTMTTPHCDYDEDVIEEAPPFEDYDEANEEALFSSSLEDDDDVNEGEGAQSSSSNGDDVNEKASSSSSSEDDEDEMDNERAADELDFEADDDPEKIFPGPRNTRTRSSSSGSAVQVLPTPTAKPSSTSLIRNKNRRRKTFKARTKKVFLLPSSSEDSSIEEEKDGNFYETFANTNEAQRRSDDEGHGQQRVTPTNYNINGKKKILWTGTSRPYLLPSSSSSSSDDDLPKPEESVTKKFIQFGVLPKNNNVNINSHAVEDQLSTFNNSDSGESLLQESELLKTKGTKERTKVLKAICTSDSSSSSSSSEASESDSDESDSDSDFSSPSDDESNEIGSAEVIENPRKGKRPNNKNKKGQRRGYQCPTCDMTFNTRRSYIYHRQTELGTSGFICEEAGCGKTFSNHMCLHDHKKKAHPSSIKEKPKFGTEFWCNICRKGFYNRSTLKRHAAVHGIGKYFCKLCGKVFSVQFDFTSHMKMHDKETSAKITGGSSNKDHPYRCPTPTCDKTFQTRRSYIYHRRRELGTSGFICEAVGCEKTFSNYIDLRAHREQAHPSSKQVKHKKGTVFRCKFCSKAFRKMWLLSRHEAIHGIGKYCCKHCGKVFSIKSHLKSHLKTHDKKT